MFRISILYLLLGACLVSSCRGNSVRKTDEKDTITVADDDPVAGSDSGTGGSLPDKAYATQINAPDNLFEDGTEPSTWENAGFTDARGFKLFLLQFKSWVRQDRVDSIVAHTRFPLGHIKNKEGFLKKYNQLFDDRLKDVVAQQRLDRIFRNEHGAMLGRGDIWFNVQDGRYVIIAIHK